MSRTPKCDNSATNGTGDGKSPVPLPVPLTFPSAEIPHDRAKITGLAQVWNRLEQVGTGAPVPVFWQFHRGFNPLEQVEQAKLTSLKKHYYRVI
jgi:hypothetical protein